LRCRDIQGEPGWSCTCHIGEISLYHPIAS
jgi:hypothetical protein